MALCVELNQAGQLQLVATQPADLTACSLVVMSGSEFVSAQASPWNLTPEQGSQIGGAILVLWALAWVFRILAGMLNSSHQPEKESQP
ncbi:hypothetical protein ACLSSQ_09155 [Azospira sp. APE16]|uniref:Uncharacterized protein n=1 Tax=Azospira oryzae (strain ATCC BAA-33 / DSM 13638 / PS) TaxID=640081 RepID=G8QN65_AZOOP|nr:hypothetical protein [Azospira oryzae]AEV26905.1 hypothetical protein Dsui_2554 [Azospira oryzae PS]